MSVRLASYLPAGPRPGWNSFESHRHRLDEHVALANVDAFAERLRPYEYFVVEDGWYNECDLVSGIRLPARRQVRDRQVDGHGRYPPSRTCFPCGLRSVIDRLYAEDPDPWTRTSTGSARPVSGGRSGTSGDRTGPRGVIGCGCACPHGVAFPAYGRPT